MIWYIRAKLNELKIHNAQEAVSELAAAAYGYGLIAVSPYGIEAPLATAVAVAVAANLDMDYARGANVKNYVR